MSLTYKKNYWIELPLDIKEQIQKILKKRMIKELDNIWFYIRVGDNMEYIFKHEICDRCNIIFRGYEEFIKAKFRDVFIGVDGSHIIYSLTVSISSVSITSDEQYYNYDGVRGCCLKLCKQCYSKIGRPHMTRYDFKAYKLIRKANYYKNPDVYFKYLISISRWILDQDRDNK